MFEALRKAKHHPLVILCDDIKVSHCIPIALRHVLASSVPCVLIALDQPVGWSEQFKGAAVVDGLTDGQPVPAATVLVKDVQTSLAGRGPGVVVLHSATLYAALHGAAALNSLLLALHRVPEVSTVLAIVHADAHPEKELPALLHSASCLIVFVRSHLSPAPYSGLGLAACVPQPPPLPNVSYDVCAVSLVHRPLHRGRSSSADASHNTPAPSHLDPFFTRLQSTTEYFRVRPDGAALALDPVDWRAACQPTPVVTAGLHPTSGPPGSLGRELLSTQPLSSVPFSLHLTPEERKAKDALLLPSAQGNVTVPQGVVYVDTEEFGDDLDDDLDI